MGLLEAIRAKWHEHAELAQELPLPRVFVEEAAPGTPQPYLVLSLERDQRALRTSSAAYDRLGLRFTIVAGQFEEAERLGHALVAAFDRTAFVIDDAGGEVLLMQLDGRGRLRTEDGLWHTLIDFGIFTTRPIVAGSPPE